MTNRGLFSRLYQSKSPVISLEFFPPKASDRIPLTKDMISSLALDSVDFMTVTYGAGGGSRAFTRELVGYIHNSLGKPAVAHLTCVGHTRGDIDEVLDQLKAEGITKILALRGDQPKGVNLQSDFSCARDLIKHIAKRGDFSIACAGYPEVHNDANSPKDDIDYLKSKIDEGAEVILTQLFFDSEIYFRFVDGATKAGITVPIVPGVMPISDISQLIRFTEMCGASIPSAISADLDKIKDDKKSVVSYGTKAASNLVSKLLKGGAPGIHLYTLNRSDQAAAILDSCL